MCILTSICTFTSTETCTVVSRACVLWTVYNPDICITSWSRIYLKTFNCVKRFTKAVSELTIGNPVRNLTKYILRLVAQNRQEGGRKEKREDPHLLEEERLVSET